MIAKGILINRVKQFEGDARKIFGGRHAVEHDGLVAGQAGEKTGDGRVATPDEKGVIPGFDDMLHGNRFDFGKVHHHAVVRLARRFDHFAGEGDLDGVAVPVQVAALALVVGDAVAGVKFKAARNLHGLGDNSGTIFPKRSISQPLQPFSSMPSTSGRLTVEDHSRDSAGMTYIYPVISRRAGGVSVGINLNPNNACNWRCIYCQVPNLKRGGPPPIDLDRLEIELAKLLDQLYDGDFLERHAPPEARRVVDIAFSGNGEPTSATEFPEAVERVGRVLDNRQLNNPPPLRLITNGSLMGRIGVQRGIALLGERGGEVWFKVDAVGTEAMRRINGAALQPETVLRRLKKCGSLCATWVQTCLFALDGMSPSAQQLDAYLALLVQAKDSLTGVHLYGLARPSLQPEAARLAALPAHWLESFAVRIRSKTGLTVQVSP